MLASAPAMYSSMLRAITDVSTGIDRLAELATITVPTLVIVGEAEAPFRKPSQRIAESIPGAELAVLQGGAPPPQFESGQQWGPRRTRSPDQSGNAHDWSPECHIGYNPVV